MISFSLMQPVTDTSEKSIELIGKQMKFLLNGICFNYLKGGRCDLLCRWSHHLPSAQDVLDKLMIFSNEAILGVYKYFISRNEMSFVNYFATMCQIFANKKMESILLGAVEHCDQHRKVFFYKNIFDALRMAGLSRRAALKKIVERSRKNKIAYTVIVNIIVETDPLHFLEMLKKFYKLATIHTHHMMKLMNQLNDNPVTPLLSIFIDMFDTYSMSPVCDAGAHKILLMRARCLASDKPRLARKLKQIESRHLARKSGL